MARRPLLIVSLALATALPALLASPARAAHRHRSSPAPSIDPSNFVDRVDNELFPLEPGTTFSYEGETDGLPTTDEVEVTHRTRQILGVDCTEVHDRAFAQGVLSEDTLDWFAQDRAGNVWYFGEDTKELDASGHVVSTEGTWLAGVDGAQPGIVMEAEPKVGDRYAQEDAPGVAEDLAKVLSLDESLCVAAGCFDHLLLTREWTPLERGVVEWKYYAEGVGLVSSVVVKGGDERSELVRIGSHGP